MAAVMLLAAAGVLHAGIAMRERRAPCAAPLAPRLRRAELPADRARHRPRARACLREVARLPAFVSDAAAPAEYYFSVLYVLSLVILARTLQRCPYDLVGLPVLLSATILWICVGPEPAPAYLCNLLLNRVLLCVSMSPRLLLDGTIPRRPEDDAAIIPSVTTELR